MPPPAPSALADGSLIIGCNKQPSTLVTVNTRVFTGHVTARGTDHEVVFKNLAGQARLSEGVLEISRVGSRWIGSDRIRLGRIRLGRVRPGGVQISRVGVGVRSEHPDTGSGPDGNSSDPGKSHGKSDYWCACHQTNHCIYVQHELQIVDHSLNHTHFPRKWEKKTKRGGDLDQKENLLNLYAKVSLFLVMPQFAMMAWTNKRGEKREPRGQRR